MRKTAARIALVVVLFAGCLCVQILVYPASRSVPLAVIGIVPVALTALFWGMGSGLAVGVAATVAISAIVAFSNPPVFQNVVILGTLFYVGMGALLGRMSDLTRANRRRAVSLDEARTRLASVLSAAKDAVITIDHNGRVTSWNAAAERMFGWSADEVSGHELHALIAGPRHRGGTGLEVLAFPRPDESRLIRTTIEVEGMRRDGSVFPAELSLASFHQEGRRHAVGIVRDTSERRESEARFRRLFETVPVGLYRTKFDGTFLDVNKAMVDLLGYPDRDTLLAANAASLYAEPEARTVILDRVEREPAVHEEIRLRAYDGSERIVLLSFRAERGHDGRTLAYEGSLRDVTEIKRYEVLRRRSERLEAVDALAAGVAHDFSNILAGIRGFAEHLTRSADGSVAGLARRIVEAVDRADRITTHLLAVTDEQGRATRRITLDELCREAIAERGAAAGAVDYEPSADAVPVVVDAAAMKFAIGELVSNALRASPREAQVVVHTGSTPTADGAVLGPACGRPGPWAWIAVVDRGTGMDDATREHIFEPYFTTKPFGAGSGLGLTRVLGILRQHGGGISVDSAPGRGTTMTIYLPQAPAA